MVSTKTDRLADATVFAMTLYEELYFRVKAGGSVKSRTFKQVYNEWSSSFSASTPAFASKFASTQSRIESYALGYFGTVPIDQIGPKEAAEYWNWRNTHYTRKQPSAATLKREKTCLVPVFKFAKRKGYITEIPSLDTPTYKPARRSTFTELEWQTFYRAAREWVKEGKLKATSRDRLVAQQYFLILANTGMRIGELRCVRWSDLRTMKVDEGTRLVASVTGKTGYREVVFQPGSEIYVRRLYDLRVGELGEAPPPSETMICHKDGTQVVSLKKSFASLMAFAKLPIVKNSTAGIIDELRYFYATRRLEGGANWYLLAKQMRTSVEMLQKFYEHLVVTEKTARDVTQSRQSLSAQPPGKYPFE